MITEDYVSFEVAKLLKEKGFDELVMSLYTSDKKPYIGAVLMKCKDVPNVYPRPTHQMAMKWLREIHRLFININIEVGDIQILSSYDFEETVLGYSFAIYDKETLDWVFKDETPRSYEEAIETALKYCLEKLI